MILLVGAGAVGSILATYLAAAGREPLRLYARDKDRALMDPVSELKVDSVDGKWLLTAPRPELQGSLDLAGIDYLFICVKYGALDGLLAQLPPVPPTCTIVSTLNGIEPLRLLKQRLPDARIVPMSVMYNGQLLGPLHGQLTTSPNVVIGSEDPRLLGCFGDSGMGVQKASGEAAVWGKLLINLANAICAVTHSDFKDLFTQPELRRVYVKVLDEAIGLLESGGIPYKLPMPVSYKAYRWMLLKGGPIPWWIVQLKNGVKAGSFPSMVSDVEQGRKTEVLQLNGEIVRLAQQQNQAAPVASRLVTLVQGMEGKAKPDYLTSAQLEKLLSQ